jgi:uncharacterized protein (TIGR03084 family)
MRDLCRDLLDEYSELAALAELLRPEEWHAQTDFYRWSPYDELAHLLLFEELAVLAASDGVEFRKARAGLEAEMALGAQISQIARTRFHGLTGPDLVPRWRKQCARLVDLLETGEPRARLPWFGPDMSARSFATARLMETWAHGQDIYDLLRRPRATSVRLRHIAHLGVVTFEWTFVNRKRSVPGPAPFVELTGPHNEVWSWGAPSTTDFVRGTALDFCLLVTQRRHLADTTLSFGGATTSEWLPIAQCFAGPPVDGPAPGVRRPS